jgi:tetrahydromethanopterin S-methyltransferase subunit D
MDFFYACDLFNVCGVIDGLHISFFQKLDKHVITILIDYYCRQKKLQFVCFVTKL